MIPRDTQARPMAPPADVCRRTAIAAAAVAGLLLTACGDRGRSSDSESLLAMLSDAEDRNPIRVVEQKPRLEIPIDQRHADAGSTKLEMARFLHQYKRTGASKLHVSAPRGEGAASQTMHDVRHLIRATGIASSAVVFGSHDARDHSIRITYARLAAVSDACGDWSQNADSNRDNLPYKNFGCAVQSNQAVMIARPTDVLYPATEAARGSERRSTDQKKHSEGALGTDTKSGISSRSLGNN